jgi:hypothetical protein
MIGGVSFQPGSGETAPGGTKKPQTGVQEAIQVLSLRLPKTVGARAIAPGALLNAQGSGGNPRIDSVVSQVLGRYFPTGATDATGGANAPMVPSSAPPGGGYGGSFTPGQIPGNTPLSELFPSSGAPRAPRIESGSTMPGPGYELPPGMAPAPNGPTEPGAAPPVLPLPPSQPPPVAAPPNPGGMDGQPAYDDTLAPPPNFEEELRRRNQQQIPSLEQLFGNDPPAQI